MFEAGRPMEFLLDCVFSPRLCGGGLAEWRLEGSPVSSRTLTEASRLHTRSSCAPNRAVVVGPARTRCWLAARRAAAPHDCFTPPSWGQTERNEGCMSRTNSQQCQCTPVILGLLLSFHLVPDGDAAS